MHELDGELRLAESAESCGRDDLPKSYDAAGLEGDGEPLQLLCAADEQWVPRKRHAGTGGRGSVGGQGVPGSDMSSGCSGRTGCSASPGRWTQAGASVSLTWVSVGCQAEGSIPA